MWKARSRSTFIMRLWAHNKNWMGLTLSGVLDPHRMPLLLAPFKLRQVVRDRESWALMGEAADQTSHSTSTGILWSLPFWSIMNFLRRQVSYWHGFRCQEHFKRWAWLPWSSQFHWSLNSLHPLCFQYCAQAPGDFMRDPRTGLSSLRCGNSIES